MDIIFDVGEINYRIYCFIHKITSSQQEYYPPSCTIFYTILPPPWFACCLVQIQSFPILFKCFPRNVVLDFRVSKYNFIFYTY